MVLIQKTDRKAVYRYLLQEGVIVIHKDFTTQPHKGTGVPNIHVRMLLRSLKDRGLVQLTFNWQYFYYFLNAQGKKYLSQFLGLTEEIVPLTWKKDQKRQYEHIVQDKGRRIKRDRQHQQGGQRKGGRGGRRERPKQDETTQQAPKQQTQQTTTA